MNSTVHWKRLVSVKMLDAWLERLVWVGPERIVITEFPNKKSASLDVLCANLKEAEKLKKLYGGNIRKIKKEEWMEKQKRTFFLRLKSGVCVASSKEAIPKKYSQDIPVIIPAGMAFGTGEHETTSMCLRRFAECKGERLLDVGTGSGIIALVGVAMGFEVMGIDFCKDSIQEAQANAKRNPHLPKVQWKRIRIEDFKSKKPYDVIVANIFSECLIGVMRKLSNLLSEGGTLILSGILKDQEKKVLAAVRSPSKGGMRKIRRLRKGKWICLVAQK